MAIQLSLALPKYQAKRALSLSKRACLRLSTALCAAQGTAGL